MFDKFPLDYFIMVAEGTHRLSSEALWVVEKFLTRSVIALLIPKPPTLSF